MSAAAPLPPATSAVCADCGKPLPPNHAGAVCRTCLWADPDETEVIEVKPGGLSLRIPGHEVESEIARGGMGIVYRAWESEAERHVALKMLLPHLADEQGMRERFRLEARAVAALDHPAVLPVYRIGVADDVPYFTMKLADGGSLLERRDRYQGKWRDIAALVASLAEAVHFAHTHGVLHRDLKPANVLFDDKDRPYLSDFGLVKIVDSESHITRSRHFLGTPHYASPEVAGASASEATVSSDVWSLGAMLYELLAGRLPFEAPGIPSLLRKIVDDPAPALPPEVPRDLSVIALKCLQKSPRQRFAGAGDLAGDLRRWLDGRSISARPMNRTERAWAWSRRNPALAGLGAGLFITLFITALALWRENTANIRALTESRNAEASSRKAEATARAAQAESLLDEARAIRRGGRILDREAAIEAVRKSRALLDRPEARDELTALLTLPRLKVTGSLPYSSPWPLPLSADFTRYVTMEHDKNGDTSQPLVWDAEKKTVVWKPAALTLPGFRPGPLSRDGRLLVTREEGRTRIWEQGKTEPLVTLPELRVEPKLSPDGKFFAGGSVTAPLHLCDLTTTPPTVRPCMTDELGWTPGAFTQDHRFFIVYQPLKFGLRVLDTATGAVLTECLPGRQANQDFYAVQSVCWSRRGDYFVAGMRDGSLVRWTREKALPEWILPAHTGAVDAVAIAADDRILVSQGRDGQVKFSDLLTLEPLGTAQWTGSALTVSPDGTQLAIDRMEFPRAELLSCQAPASAESGIMPPTRDPNSLVARRRTCRVLASPDGQRFAVSSGTDVTTFDSDSVRRPLMTECVGRIHDLVLDYPSGRWLRRLDEEYAVMASVLLTQAEPEPAKLVRMGGACSAAYDPLSRRVLLGHRQGFCLYNFSLKGDGVKPKRESVKPWRLPGDRSVAVSAVAWSLDGKQVAWAGTDTREKDDETGAPPPHPGVPVLHVFTPEPGGPEVFTKVLPAPPHILAFVSGGDAVVTADETSVACYELSTGKELWRRPHRCTGRDPAHLTVARSAETLAVTFDPHTVSIVDPANGAIALTLTHPQDRVIQAMDITPDGKRLLALAGNLVQLWRVDILRQELEEQLKAGG